MIMYVLVFLVSSCLSATKLANTIIVLKTNEAIDFDENGTIIPRDILRHHQLWKSGGERSKSHETEISHRNPFR